ncbi:hypothetical protein [Pelagibius marinus]|uniref:hypothetical protein n=1 Tax=Pelagibius marinus TaxID=2762760 RepID=UPI0018723D87|nr:hypothetical protein [Pelagibius marinus]
MSGKSIFGGSVVIAAAVVAYLAVALHFGSFDPRAFFVAEPGLKQLAMLSRDNPRVDLESLLEGDWDAACFLSPYLDLAADPALAGVEVPWIDNDGFNTVVLKRGAEYELQKFSRGEISIFELTGLPDGRLCYDGTALVIEVVPGGGEPFKTLRVAPR